MAVIGYMFTAAGYQYLNLGKKIYDSTWSMRQYYDKVEKKYEDFKINKLSFIGPEDELAREENGIIINAVYQRGVFELLKDYKVNPEQLMGFKSGEIMALACGGAISFEDAIEFLFKKRQLISEEVGGDLFFHLLVNTLQISKIEQVVSELQGKVKTNIASYNGKDSAIVVCEKKSKDSLKDVFKKLGGSVIELPNEEFACIPLLQTIADKLKADFLKIPMDKPVNRILCQTTGNYYENVQEIKEKCLEYIWKPSRIDFCIETMLKNAVNTFVEIGPGSFLSRMARKRDSGKRTLNTNDLGEIQKSVKLSN